MTQNIEQRTLAAVNQYENASGTIDKFAHADEVLNIPTGAVKTFPKISKEWDENSKQLTSDWKAERDALSIKALPVLAWANGETETDLNQQRRFTDGHTYLPKSVPALMNAEPDAGWIAYTADKSDVLSDVFGSKPVDLICGLVITPINNQYPKLAAFNAIYELSDNSASYIVKSFTQTIDSESILITLDDNSVKQANKVQTSAQPISNSYSDGRKVFVNPQFNDNLDGFYKVQINNKVWYSLLPLHGTFVSLTDNNDYGTASLVTSTNTFEVTIAVVDAMRRIGDVAGWGVKYDGSIETLALQTALDSFNANLSNSGGTLNREYSVTKLHTTNVVLVDDTISLNKSYNIGMLSIKAAPQIWGGKQLLTTKLSQRYWGNIDHLILDGNGQDCRGFLGGDIYGSRWNKVDIFDTKKTACQINAPGFELFMTNYRLILHKDCDADARSLVINAGDGHYTNGTGIFGPIGCEINGASNIVALMHNWSGYYPNGKDTGEAGGREQRVGFLVNAANNQLLFCQSDSPSKADYTKGNLDGVGGIINGGVGFYLGDNAYRCKLIGCALVVNSTLYNRAAETDNRPTNSPQILKWYCGGKDNSFTDFRCESKSVIHQEPLYKSNTVKYLNSVSGSDNVQSITFTRNTFPAQSLNTESGQKIAEYLVNGSLVGGISSLDGFDLSIVAKDTLRFKLDTKPDGGLRLYAGGGTERLEPLADGLLNIGSANNRVANLFVVNSPVIGSDASLKYNIQCLPQQLIELGKWIPKNIKMFQWLSKFNSKDEKEGINARYHSGLIAQELVAAFDGICKKLNITDDIMRYGFIGLSENGEYRIRPDELMWLVISSLNK